MCSGHRRHSGKKLYEMSVIFLRGGAHLKQMKSLFISFMHKQIALGTNMIVTKQEEQNARAHLNLEIMESRRYC